MTSGAILPYKTISWQAAGAWILCAAASFHLSYEITACAPFIVVFFICVYRLAHVGKGVHALRAGWLLGLLVYGPQLAFFWSIFGVSALGLWLVLSCWLALFLVLQRFALIKLGALGAVVAAPILWLGLEYSRSELYYLRFSWVNAGYLYPGLSYWIGMYGVGFLAMFLGAWIATAVEKRRWILCAAGVAVTVPLFAFVSPGSGSSVSQSSLKVAGVQLEFPTSPAVISALDQVHAKHPDTPLLVLSEYTFNTDVPRNVRDWCASNHCYLVAGGRDHIGGIDSPWRNTAFVIGPDGKDVFKQAKCVPIQFFSDGMPASQQQVWDSPWGKLGICICYDLSYTRVTDELIRQGAQAIIIPTMDVERWGERQHNLHARVAPVRASEYGVPIFRLCSSGISQSITGRGRVVAHTAFPGQGETLAGTLELSTAGGRMPVDRFLVWPCVAATAILLAWSIVDAFTGRARLKRAAQAVPNA